MEDKSLSASITVKPTSYTGSKKDGPATPIYVTGVRGNDGNASILKKLGKPLTFPRRHNYPIVPPKNLLSAE